MCITASVSAQSKIDSLSKGEIDSLFSYHFSNLDSSVKSTRDTVYFCCPYSIEFIETNTNIFSRADINFAGKWKFFKSDWEKWHSWYSMNQKNLYWDKEKKVIKVKKNKM